MLELQFQKAACRFLNCISGGVQNLELTQELKLTDGMPDIGRVLCAWGQVIARSKEWRNGDATFSGGVMVWVLYLPEDGTEPRCMESWLPFQARWDFPETDRDGTLNIRCNLRFVDARNVSARRMMLRLGVGVRGEAYLREEQDIYMPEPGENAVELLKNVYPIRLLREAGEKSVLLDEELTLPESCPQAEKIVYYSFQPEITEKKVLSDKVLFRGNTNLHVLYRSEEGQLFAWDFAVPFSQYAELDDAYGAEAETEIDIAVSNAELELSEEGHFRLKCALVGQYLIEDTQLAELAEDAYCPGRECRVQMGALSVPAILEKRQEPVAYEQSVQEDANLVVDTVFLTDHPRQTHSGEILRLEMPGTFQVLLYGPDRVLQSHTARCESVWEMRADEGTSVDAALKPMGRPQSQFGTEISLSAPMQLELRTVSAAPIPMVTGMELGEAQQPDPDRPSVILRRAGQQRLWDIARGCGTTVGAIRAVNRIEGEPTPDQMLLIPVQ